MAKTIGFRKLVTTCSQQRPCDGKFRLPPGVSQMVFPRHSSRIRVLVPVNGASEQRILGGDPQGIEISPWEMMVGLGKPKPVRETDRFSWGDMSFN